MATVTLEVEEYEQLKAERDEWERKYRNLTKDVDTFVMKSDITVEQVPQMLFEEFLYVKISTKHFEESKLLGAFKFRMDVIKKQGRLY